MKYDYQLSEVCMILYIVYDFKNLFIQLGLLLTLHFLLCLNFTIVFKIKLKLDYI